LPQIEVLAQHLPIRIEFVETPEKVDEVLPTLYEMVSDGLIEVQDTTVVKLARKSAKPEPRIPHAKLLRVFMGEADKWHEAPLYDAIVKKLLIPCGRICYLGRRYLTNVTSVPPASRDRT
jgi:PII-like signaling protein